MLSYFIPIALIFFRGRQHLPVAYWRLPDWLGKFCAVVSLLYIPFITILFFLPNYAPVDGAFSSFPPRSPIGRLTCPSLFSSFQPRT
jgi:choline transport protein